MFCGPSARFRCREDPLLGRSTLNIGTIAGGRAPNVVADHAQAEIMFRTVGDPAEIREAVLAAAAGRAEAREVLHTPAMRLSAFDGLPTTVVAFATDIPTFDGAWGQPFLIGPGSIHVAHTAEERIPKKQLSEAVDIYARMVRQLLATGARASMSQGLAIVGYGKMGKLIERLAPEYGFEVRAKFAGGDNPGGQDCRTKRCAALMSPWNSPRP